ncbi:hypothetical protein KGP36_03050 [Patescibacteria group bacterium]|nr:hypothetical protein [Patescibacteria group bacterium]
MAILTRTQYGCATAKTLADLGLKASRPADVSIHRFGKKKVSNTAKPQKKKPTLPQRRLAIRQAEFDKMTAVHQAGHSRPGSLR